MKRRDFWRGVGVGFAVGALGYLVLLAIMEAAKAVGG